MADKKKVSINSESDNTVFDAVFRTMVTKIPELIIPVINEVFGKNYPQGTKFEQLRNEQIIGKSKIITDSIIKIEDNVYHIECQRRKDKHMVVRMIEYDFTIAVDNADLDESVIKMPESCVLHLDTSDIDDELKIRIVFADGAEYPYKTKVVKVQNYTKDEIFEKNLLMFLPYYIIRYQDKYSDIENNSEKLNGFIQDFKELNRRLGEATVKKKKSAIYSDLNKLIVRIADYMLSKEEKLRKGVEDAMGGNILELESERLTKNGVKRGLKIGKLLSSGYSIEKISELLGISCAEIEDAINSLNEEENNNSF